MAEINRKKFKIFSLSANRALAKEIAEYMNVPLSDCSISRFADGEIQIDIGETVRGHHVFVVQPTHTPVNENIMELLVMVDALKRASAKTINLIVPYYGYSRQDRKARARQPITAKLVANLIEAAGATRMMTMDLHASQIQGFFDIPIDDFRALPTMAKYFMEKNLEDVVVASPDHGGATRARKLAEYLDVPIAIIDKRRPKPNVAEVMGLIGEVEGKTAVIIDDMIDTAGTLQTAANELQKRGAKAVYAACTHPILSGPAVERIDDSALVELVTTNTICLDDKKKSDKINQLSIGYLLAEGIKHILNDQPVSDLFKPMAGIAEWQGDY
ncbi:MAG: ribose-phosphate pyrophosphokinase [Turicibacter sp.]|nr:ribose-phosphate pyrophosphokinase [Turicibacter sp.]